MKLQLLGAFLTAGVSLALASNPVLPGAYLGTQYLTINGWENAGAGCDANGCGGEFSGTVTHSNNGLSPQLSNFWCVDAQEDVSFGDAGYANFVSLADISSHPDLVRFSGVTNGPGDHWTDTALPDSAATRYAMAAWLVQQYQGFNNVGGPVISSFNNPVDDAIQRAIWTITNNSTLPGGYYNPTDSTIGAWITEAAKFSNYSTVDTSAWAVVSWDADPVTGALASPGRQTLLVQVAPTPEPSFYGALAVGLSGLFVAVRKRKKVSENPSVS